MSSTMTWRRTCSLHWRQMQRCLWLVHSHDRIILSETNYRSRSDSITISGGSGLLYSWSVTPTFIALNDVFTVDPGKINHYNSTCWIGSVPDDNPRPKSLNDKASECSLAAGTRYGQYRNETTRRLRMPWDMRLRRCDLSRASFSHYYR